MFMGLIPVLLQNMNEKCDRRMCSLPNLLPRKLPIYFISTGCPVCLVLRQGAVNQLFLEVSLMFLACLDHARWAKFHLGILGPQE